MKIAYKHLLRFLPENPKIEDLSERLFQLGHEHEIENNIFDFEFTPNRGDCLSLMGLARDLNIFYETNLKPESFDQEIPNLEFSFTNKETVLCPKISFLHIEIDGKIGKYRNYLNEYFEDLGLQKVNFFTDVSNFLSYELGQPTHCYDYTKISQELTLEKTTESVEFCPLIGNKIILDKSELVFKVDKKIINLAGVMGSSNSGCVNGTKSVIVECAYFNPEAILGKALKYNFASDAAHKFERGVDPDSHERVLRRFLKIVSDHTNIKNLGIFSKSYQDFRHFSLDYDLSKINNVLGVNIDDKFFKKSLNDLCFKTGEKIEVPTFRNDISHQNDIAEELARVIGYDNLPTKEFSLSPENSIDQNLTEEIIREQLYKKGFSEVINFPFNSVKSEDSLKIDNPLDKNKSYLRTNLLNSLLKNLVFNENRQKDLIKIYEISDIYLAHESQQKIRKIGILVAGRQGNNYIDFTKKMDANYLASIFDDIDLDISDSIKSIDRSGIKSKAKDKVFFAEFSLDALSLEAKHFEGLLHKRDFVKYQSISEFPSSFRDFSFSVKDPAQIKPVLDKLAKFKSEILKKSFLFDYYFNKKSCETKIGYRFIFQSSQKTLQDDDIESEVSRMLNDILSINSVDIPGKS